MPDLVSHFVTKTVAHKFRGIDFEFDLSQGLFSSAGVDSGTKLLLKVFSQVLDADIADSKPLPRAVLDAGCGVGVIGICAAAALKALGADPTVRAQDRDELARLITSHNARKNHLPVSTLESFAEPLLAGHESAKWDLILTNIPAKAGKPVLEDFVRRSAGLLNPGGRVIMVVVYTLADFFRQRITAEGLHLEREEQGTGHHVLVYGGGEQTTAAEPVKFDANFLVTYPFYRRGGGGEFIAEKISVQLETIHGAGGFDRASGAEIAAAHLIRKLGSEKIFAKAESTTATAPLLIHEPSQGFFPCWLREFLRGTNQQMPPTILSGRNVLALEAARHNFGTANIVPAADLALARNALLGAAGEQYGCIAAFPELLPQSSLETDQFTWLWESLPPLLAKGGVFIAGFTSTDAERFDRKKPTGFTRLDSVKSKGFRAVAYRW